MTAAELIARGRAATEKLMTDTVTISRVTGPEGEMDPVTGERDPAPTETVYSGAAKIQTYEPHESARESGEHVYTEQRYHLHLPVGTPQVRVDDSVTVSAAVYDAALVGKTYRVAGTHHKSLATAQRLLLDEITG